VFRTPTHYCTICSLSRQCVTGHRRLELKTKPDIDAHRVAVLAGRLTAEGAESQLTVSYTIVYVQNVNAVVRFGIQRAVGKVRHRCSAGRHLAHDPASPCTASMHGQEPKAAHCCCSQFGPMLLLGPATLNPNPNPYPVCVMILTFTIKRG